MYSYQNLGVKSDFCFIVVYVSGGDCPTRSKTEDGEREPGEREERPDGNCIKSR